MELSNAMLTSRAQVATDRSDRYAKQLADHLGRRNDPVAEPDGVRLVFSRGSCLLTPGPDQLLLTATAPDEDALSTVEEVVSRHLERIGRRDELMVAWLRERPG
jgi:hypothetical protein